MNLTAVSTTPPTTPPAKLDPTALHGQFSSIVEVLTNSDETLSSMVANANPVGTGWGSFLGGVAARVQTARDGLISLKPEAAELATKLGVDVLKLAEAAGSLTVMGRQRATLSAGWTTFLDTAIADAQAAVTLLAPAAPPTTPPTTPPATPPTTPPATPPAIPPLGPVLPSNVAKDVSSAAQLVSRSIEWIRTVPVTDRGDASTKDARIAAFNLNMDAQKLLEGHFRGDAAITSALRTADARLEDANWQLAKKPSPDGRFNGVDVPGALRDSQAAAEALNALVRASGQSTPLAA